MYTEISFPAFDFVWNPSRSFSIGSFPIYWYGVLIGVGLLMAILYGCGRCKEFGLKDDDIIDGVLWIVPLALVCTRLYYCIFRWEEGGYADDPLSVFDIRDGGLAIYGGVIGAAIGIVIYAIVKKDKVRLTAVLDLTSLGFLIGQSVGRWGNFFNREAFGAETDSFLRMGLMDKLTGEITYHHPTFLYESLWNLCGFFLLHFLSKKRKYDGQIALGYVAWYGLGRTFIEGLRTDSLYLGPFRVSQLLAALSCFAAVTVLVVMAFRTHKPEDLFVNVKARREAEEAARLEAEEAADTQTAEETE